ncbi:MAG: citramalate synthase [Pseudomonadota bacterium]
MTTRAMAKDRIYLYDTTLRDGAQTQGVDFSVADKRLVAQMLDTLGIDYVEGGWPGANPTDTEFFADPPALTGARFTAFGMTKRAGRSASNDPGLAPLLSSSAPAICVVGKSWDYHVETALGVSLDENLDAISETVEAIVAAGKEALFDAEHFFDGFKARRDYAIACVNAALGSGARWAVLCDTNGGTLPHEVERIVRDVSEIAPGDKLGIHAHNDTGMAVANSLAAIRGGARHVQGTLNGLGERCGNANLVTLIPNLMLKPELAEQYETGVTREALATLTHVSQQFDDLMNRLPDRHAPYVGDAAFAHKGGLHVSAIRKNPDTYEHVPPESVGNARKILVSDQSGRATILSHLSRLALDHDADHPRVAELLDYVKEREAAGYAYDTAEASFEILARRRLTGLDDYFKVETYRVAVENRFNALGERITVTEATLKITAGGETTLIAAEGDGPVHALDQALRKSLTVYAEPVSDLRLENFKVRILNTGTEAITRALIESIDKDGERWFTVGVSPNIIDASFEALLDAFRFKLMKWAGVRKPS